MTNPRPFILGLTGSIGMGKSTTAAFFRDFGVPVWDADATVHQLYDKGGAAVDGVEKLVSGATVNGAIDRQKLKEWLSKNPDGLQQLEEIVHPLVAQNRTEFLKAAAVNRQKIVLVDVPLLFETGAADYCDAVVVVTASQATQQERVLARQGMTTAHFERILEKQMPDDAKRKLADYVIETDTLENARSAVKDVLQDVMTKVDLNA